MDGFAHYPRGDTLFAEDFDLPENAPEPEVIEPVFSASELAVARETAWRDGHAAGLQEAAASDAAVTRQAVTEIAEQFMTERAAGAASAESSAEAIARLLLDSLAATFPALCARYGDEEVHAIARLVLPALSQEPAITVRAHPHTAAALAREITRLAPEIAEHVQTIECDGMARGDVRIAWRNGSSTRDAASLWRQVAAVLVPAGLLQPDEAIEETRQHGE